MVDFRPIHGCRFNVDIVEDMARVLCPPYDMIDSNLQRDLKTLSPYNAVHLEGAEQPDPLDPEKSYIEASSLYRNWLEQNVLKQDEEPNYYLMRYGYQFDGDSKNQLGLFGGIAVEDYDNRTVLPHEFTREPAVQDRVKLLESCKAQFSPIMSLYRDSAHILEPRFAQIMAKTPDIEIEDPVQGHICFWAIADSESIDAIRRSFVDKPIFLADGHHRYEAALRNRSNNSNSNNDANNFVMMALVEFDDPGLQLLPYHRGIGSISSNDLENIRKELDNLFDSIPFDLSVKGVETLAKEIADLGKNQHVVGVIGPEINQAEILTLKKDIDWKQWGPLAMSEAWVLEEKVLKTVLGNDAAKQADYSHDAQGLRDRISSKDLQIAFLLKPFPMDTFEEIVGGGQRLPSKSTFFFPKLPTGLVIHRLEGQV